jgi:hypothetical protein
MAVALRSTIWSVPDVLRKEIGGYVPGDIKSGRGEEGGGEDDGDGKPKLHYAVQLAIYVDILERIGFSAGRRGFIWDVFGDEVAYDFKQPQGPRKPETLWDSISRRFSRPGAFLGRQLFLRVPTRAAASYATGTRIVSRI